MSKKIKSLALVAATIATTSVPCTLYGANLRIAVFLRNVFVGQRISCGSCRIVYGAQGDARQQTRDD